MRFFSLILLVGLLALWQAFGLSVFGVKPNLVLAVIIAVSFFVENIWQGLLLTALAGFILKFSPGFESEILILSLIGIAMLAVKKYHPWHYFLANLISIALGTLIFYAFFGAGLIGSIVFLKELLLNLLAGIIIFAFLSFLWHNKQNEVFLYPY